MFEQAQLDIFFIYWCTFYNGGNTKTKWLVNHDLVGWNRSLTWNLSNFELDTKMTFQSIYNTIKPINNSPPSGLGRYILLNFDRVKNRKCLTYYLTLRDRAIGSVMNFPFRLGAISMATVSRSIQKKLIKTFNYITIDYLLELRQDFMNYFIKFVFFDAILGSSRLQYRLDEKL